MWMIAYDISEDRIRYRVAKILENYGTRVQYSVFECRLREQEGRLLREQLLDLLEQGDSLRWYPLCVWCRNRIVRQGCGEETQFEDYYLL
ncbi:MAG: CRISPR-associated endonuclease Cas2 [Candidatus Electrothrix sp. GM3_4]|nr:CRISPR-associated endonuclease Cas2 [Candidatus Electrothrix sp. GM3_4]